MDVALILVNSLMECGMYRLTSHMHGILSAMCGHQNSITFMVIV